jgi:hypothetical protein
MHKPKRWPMWRVALWAFLLAGAVALGLQLPTMIIWVLAYCGLLPW